MGDSRVTIQDVIRERVYNTSDENEDVCACRGRGWHVSDWDTWEPCPCHPRLAGRLGYCRGRDDPRSGLANGTRDRVCLQ